VSLRGAPNNRGDMPAAQLWKAGVAISESGLFRIIIDPIAPAQVEKVLISERGYPADRDKERVDYLYV
jgi:hypothetical protein